MTRAYLDHASSSPLRPGALDAMLPFLRDHPADPGRVHGEGRITRNAIEVAREQVAALFGARPREVVFTSSGTESVNTAVFGAIAKAVEQASGERLHVVTTAVEHSSVLESCLRAPAEMTIIDVDPRGRVDPEAVTAALRPDTVLVSVQLANHEVGTIQTGLPVIVDALDTGRRSAGSTGRRPLLHVDACAAAGHVPVGFATLGADLCSVTGHKLGGPKGAAALLIRRGLRVPPFVVGGMQERARRGGIEDVAAIVGFGAAAAELAMDARLEREADAARTRTDRIVDEACAVDGIERFGDPDARLPNLVCLGIDGVEAEPVLLGLDQRGIAAHSGSSCSSEALEPSPVLAAMGVDSERSLRVSVGWSTTDAEVDAFGAAFPDVVQQLRALRSAS